MKGRLSPSHDALVHKKKTAADIREEKEKDDAKATIYEERAELVTPMARIRGLFKLTKKRIIFEPDDEQPPDSNASVALETSLALDKMNLSTTPRLAPNNHPSLSPGRLSGHSNHLPPVSSNLALSAKCFVPSPLISHNKRQMPPSPSPLSPGAPSQALLQNKRSNARSTPHIKQNTKNIASSSALDDSFDPSSSKYWVITTAVKSYQHVGGNRYRIMSANRKWNYNELMEMHERRYIV